MYTKHSLAVLVAAIALGCSSGGKEDSALGPDGDDGTSDDDGSGVGTDDGGSGDGTDDGGTDDGGTDDGGTDDGGTDDGGTDDGGTDDGDDAGSGDDGTADIDWDSLNGDVPTDPVSLPEFAATNMDGSSRSREDVLGHPTVMWFYPAAATAG